MSKSFLGILIFVFLVIIVAGGYILFINDPFVEKVEYIEEEPDQSTQDNEVLVETILNEDNETISIYSVISERKESLGVFPKRSKVFYYPKLSEVVVFTPPEREYLYDERGYTEEILSKNGSIQKISLKDPVEKTVFLNFDTTPIKELGDDRTLLFSPDKRKFVFSFDDRTAGNHPYIGLVNLDSNIENFKTLYRSDFQPSELFYQHVEPLFWDSNNYIYIGFHAHKGVCSPVWNSNDVIALSENGDVIENTQTKALKSFLKPQNLVLTSPGSDYFVGIRQHPEGIEGIGMCPRKSYGIITIYSVNDTSSEIIQSDSSKDFWFVTWVNESNAFIYKQRSATDVNSDSSSEYEEYVLYDVHEGEKEIFGNEQEMNTWLEENAQQNNSFEKIF